MIELNLAEAGSAMGCLKSRNLPALPLPSISTDSRTAGPGHAFFALRGDRLDGHDFIPRAVERGVQVVVHSSTWKPDPGSSVISLRVPDTTRALQDLAARVRRKWKGQVVAVTGSMGKTITRHFTATLLAERYRVHQSRANLNNHFGLPLSLLELEPDHQVAVLELGMNHAGEIRRLSEICDPDLGLITNVAPAHLAFFRDLDSIAAAKGELLEGLKDGVFIYNADDQRVRELASRFQGETHAFGFAASAAVRILDFEFLSLSSMNLELRLSDGLLETSVPFVGSHFLYNIAAAAAVGQRLGLTCDQILTGIQRLRAPSNRGRICRVFDDTLSFHLWDDSYNANPHAVLSVLQTLAALPFSGRRVVVLGDMLELGERAARLHREIGAKVAESGIDLLVAVGALSLESAQAAIEAGMEHHRVFHFADSRAAGNWLIGRVEPGDLILVKGSRGIATEAVVDRLREGREVTSR